MKGNNPETPAEWQDAVNAAYASLALDSARQYGLVEGGPTVDVERCQEILDEGLRIGLTPNKKRYW